jgi:hypothetical protein
MSVDYHFIENIANFLNSHRILFTEENHLINIDATGITIRLVPAGTLVQSNKAEITKDEATITIYEDQWITRRSVIEGRLLAILGKGGVIFARNCSVRKLTTEQVSRFIQENHMLGYARSRYKYGLFTRKAEGDLTPETLVCVATFSEPRTMNRGGVEVKSYEWVRYASLGAIRVTGGMGKLLNYFIQDVRPQEIMSYADLDWSRGNSYIKLGFTFLERTEPIEFYVDRSSMKRYTMSQLKRQSSGISTGEASERFYTLNNQGNLKFIRSTILNG